MKNYFLKAFALFSLAIIIASCNSDDFPEVLAPTVLSETTSGNVEVNYTTIIIKGSVSSDGGAEITARGVCWSTNPSPTIADNKTSEISNTFTSTISNLVANTTYYFRVYATNDAGTGYAAEQVFTTSSLDDTKWDFYLIHDATIPSTWHADVTFNADGTTIYDEPSFPGTFLTIGTWSLNGNILTYDMDSGSADNSSYQFTGIISNNVMSGVYNWGTAPDKTWTATKYP